MKNKKRNKGLFVVVWSDDKDAYIFDTKEEAIKQTEGDLKDIDTIKVGTTAKLYDLSKVKCLREMKLELIVK